MNNNFTVKFWGVRGSYPAPGAQTVYYGGNTACVEVRVAGHTIILDAGTGIIPLGRELVRRDTQPVLLFSHLHHDHTQGFPFFSPAYHPAAHLDIYGPDSADQTLKNVLDRNQAPPAFPIRLDEMRAAKVIQAVTETDVITFENGSPCLVQQSSKPGLADDLRIRMMKSYAHPGGVIIYRIDWHGHSLVYATDTEGYIGVDQRLAAFASGADLLIHDAQYSDADYALKQGFGHSTPRMACELALMAGVKQLALFHYDPSYDDSSLHALEQQARSVFKGVFAAREGQTLELTVNKKALPAERRRCAAPTSAYSASA